MQVHILTSNIIWIVLDMKKTYISVLCVIEFIVLGVFFGNHQSKFWRVDPSLLEKTLKSLYLANQRLKKHWVEHKVHIWRSQNYINIIYPLVNWHSYGQSPCLMDTSTINVPCSIASCEFPRTYIHQHPSIIPLSLL